MHNGVDIELFEVSAAFENKRFNSQVFDKLSVRFKAGEFTSIVGPSGAGKSTLLRLVAGLIMPTTGAVRIGSKPTLDAQRAMQIAFVPQHLGLFQHLDVSENVSIGARLHRPNPSSSIGRLFGRLSSIGASFAKASPDSIGASPVRTSSMGGRFDRTSSIDARQAKSATSSIDARQAKSATSSMTSSTQEILEALGIASLANRLPSQISGGQRQRVALARALALDAPVLLCDEPFAALDDFTRADARLALLEVWSQTNSTTVFVTHHLADAVLCSDRILVLAHNGEIAHDIRVTSPRPRPHEIEDDQHLLGVLRDLRLALRVVDV